MLGHSDNSSESINIRVWLITLRANLPETGLVPSINEQGILLVLFFPLGTSLENQNLALNRIDF
jgi:hypothetical protein